MHGTLREALPASTKITGSLLPGGEESFPNDFGAVARVLWPRKTAQQLAAIANASDRAAKDWLSGKVEPPGIVIAAVVWRLVRRRR